MKKLLVVLLTIYAFSCHAQNAEIDSLISEIGRANDDTNKVNLYNSLLFCFAITPTEEPEKYVLPALSLSDKLSFNVVGTRLSVGRVYWKLGKWDMALKYHFEAIKLVDEKKDPDRYAKACTYIGQDYADGGNYQEALKYFEKAEAIYQKIHDEEGQANTYLLIAWIHSHQGNYVESSKANLAGLKLFESIKDEFGAAIASGNLADDYLQLDKNKEAIYYVTKGLSTLEKKSDYVNLSGCHLRIAKAYLNLKKYDAALKSIRTAYEYGERINDKIQMGDARSLQADIYFRQNKYEEAAEACRIAIEYYKEVNAGYLLARQYSKLGICYVRLNKPEQAQASLDSAARHGKTLDSRELLSEYLNGQHMYDSLQGNWNGAYHNYYKHVSIRDSIYNADNSKKLLQNQVQYEFDKKEAEARAEQEKKDLRQRVIRNSLTALLASTVIFLVIVYRQRNKIAKARKRSDELLLNILPEEVAEELKAKGAAEAVHIDKVTVLFTDFKGFTALSEMMSPQQLIQDLNECFSAFDHITEKYGIEKIKTIGDSYMAAGGLPTPNATHVMDVIAAAFEMRDFIAEGKARKIAAGLPFFEIRIGVHTGPVVAGIVGVKKFQYDIWGDTVNTASRMESSGEVGKINISQTTYELLKGQPGFVFESRGKIVAKGKGEIEMYFVSKA